MSLRIQVHSAQGILSQLSDDLIELKIHALKSLRVIVDSHWVEIADFLNQM